MAKKEPGNTLDALVIEERCGHAGALSRYGFSKGQLIVMEPQKGFAGLLAHLRTGKIDSVVWRGFKVLFLPEGYPDSVSNDYAEYQRWDTAQARALSCLSHSYRLIPIFQSGSL